MTFCANETSAQIAAGALWLTGASETAQRNPMRPPDSSPTTASAAVREFMLHPSPQLIALYVAILVAWRISLGFRGYGLR